MNTLNMEHLPHLSFRTKFIDLFCGIGGFRYAMEAAAEKRLVKPECVLSSDIDTECQRSYEANFGERPLGDITKIHEEDVPSHDVLLAGFPCQPFSIIGKMRGFHDTRGTLFFHIARILKEKRPRAFVLENVKLLAGHNNGETLRTILNVLTEELGYTVEYRIFNALNFGLPQKRERIWIVGFREPNFIEWPEGNTPMTPLGEILEENVPEKFFASVDIREKRRQSLPLPLTVRPTIWHENKAGHVSAYPYSCALRAGASYNYLLVDGERRLTPREMLRLQGFPESFKIVCSDSQTGRQAGNSLPVAVATAVIEKVLHSLRLGIAEEKSTRAQLRFFEKHGETQYATTKTKNC
jgi:DNA (cytosine-5)-methyltransferase 1